MIPASQTEAAALLRARCAGSGPGEEVETALSVVFLGADEAFKLRKAVRLNFVDFTDPAARRRAAEREMALNAPAVPGLYRGVAALTRAPDGTLAFDGSGEAVEWVVRMARLPPEAFLERLAPERLTPELLDSIGDAVAAWHARAEPAACDIVAAMDALVESNAASARGEGLEEARIAAWDAGMRAALAARQAWMVRRGAAGFVRRCHGDLHLGNFCFWQGRPAPFDALEFDEALACIDTGYDLAFLLVDLELKAGRAAANRVLNRYVARTGDAGLVGGLVPFLSLRAMVRAHCLARVGERAAAARALAAAEAALAPVPAVAVAVGGLPGVGKSTLARTLAPGLGAAPGALVLRSDEIRKRRFGVPPEQRLPETAYAEAVSREVMAELCRAAGEAVALGHSVVADAAFLDPADRTAIAQAVRGPAPFLGVWLRAPLAVLEARIAARRGDASDATIEVLRRAAAAWPEEADWLAVPATDAAAAAAQVRCRLAGKSC